MFDSINLRKAYKLEDSITSNMVEVATFNATLTKNGSIDMGMNINYPHLYTTHKEEILIAYREFCGEATAMGATIGLSALKDELEPSKLKELEPITEEFKEMATKTFQEVIESLGNIVVNPVPGVYDRYEGGDPYRYNRY